MWREVAKLHQFSINNMMISMDKTEIVKVSKLPGPLSVQINNTKVKYRTM